ncbi:MAG: hypothetical protein BV456_13455 [Thermoplasmata archaeon M8B2D]|nr:MAG: hypothetical protein BV456_13455 [Thermoplasmata archaeon M8B2D]
MIKKLGIKTEKISLAEAYAELTPSVFAAFVIMSNTTKKTIRRNKLPKMLNTSRSSCSRILEQLNLMEYIKIENKGVGKPSKIIFLKRMIIEKGTRFVIS